MVDVTEAAAGELVAVDGGIGAQEAAFVGDGGDAFLDERELVAADEAHGEAHLRNIPSGSYEFWPYRSASEAESIVAAGSMYLAPIQVNVGAGENKIAVKFNSRRR